MCGFVCQKMATHKLGHKIKSAQETVKMMLKRKTHEKIMNEQQENKNRNQNK